MNHRNAKTLSQRDVYSVLPSEWIDILDNILSIIKHSKYPSFKHAETFLVAGLSYVPNKEKSSIKHIKAKCSFKGEHDGKIYITIDMWFYMKDKRLWKLSKSVHVFKREKQMSYD